MIIPRLPLSMTFEDLARFHIPAWLELFKIKQQFGSWYESMRESNQFSHFELSQYWKLHWQKCVNRLNQHFWMLCTAKASHSLSHKFLHYKSAQHYKLNL